MSRTVAGALFLGLMACGTGGGGDGAAGGRTVTRPDLNGPTADAAEPAPAWPPTDVPTVNPPPVAEPCTGLTDVCLLPFPASNFEVADSTQASGFRVSVDAQTGLSTLWEKLAKEPADGFSPVGTLATYVPAGVDLTKLPATPEETTGADSPILLLDVLAGSPTWGQALPWRATSSPAGEKGGRVLFLTPLTALKPSGRYAVVVDRRLPTETETAFEPTAEMARRLGDGNTDAAGVYARDLVAAAHAAGREPGDVVQLWDFHIRSAGNIRADFDALSAYDVRYAAEQTPPPATAPEAGTGAFKRYTVTVDVPRWRADRFASINRDAEGAPTPLGTLPVECILVVPDNATPEHPAIPILFGHGLSASAELMYFQLVPKLDLSTGPYALLMPDWDLHGKRGNGLQDILAIAGGLEGTAFAHSLLQSASDSLVFSHALAHLGETDIDGRGHVIRTGPVYFLGQSLGSMIGAIGNAVDPNVRAAVWNVGGGALSAILREGIVVEKLGLKDAIRDIVTAEPIAGLSDDQAVEVVMTMSQLPFDVGDPASLAAADLRPQVPVVLQESLGDGIVVNPASELFARTLGLPLVTPTVSPVPMMDVAAAPTLGQPSHGMTQFHVSNEGFNAHLALNSPAVQAQAMHFFASFEDADPANDGDIAYDCGGEACDLVP